MSGSNDLRPFVEALYAELDAKAREHRPVPDLAGVLARAEALDPGAIPAGLRDSMPLDDGPDEPEREDAGLLVFAEALRERHEQVLHERRHAPIPAPPSLERRPRWLPWVLGVAAAAIVAVAIGAGLSAVEGQRQRDPSAMEAERSRFPLGTGGSVSHRGGSAEPVVRLPEPEPEPEPESEPEPEPELEVIASPATTEGQSDALAGDESTGGSPEPAVAKPTMSTASLEAEARRAWGRGELAQAERLFRIIVRREGRSSRAELAYGDLFSLARQRRGPSGQADVWREYLRRFPRGRYAQDARAGLCRREPAERRARCWQRYLDAHPQGAHAAEARAAVSKAPP
ncbi:MAG: hypothetical protein KDK70_19140 [Myxococcales bacterium]|nr:hypothetical protein [Myxococcales bacterium]